MSTYDIATYAWRAFWNNVTAPATLSIVLLAVLACVFIGFAFRATIRAVDFALRAAAGIIGFLLIVGLLGALGINMQGLTPFLNQLLELMRAPIYLPEHA